MKEFLLIQACSTVAGLLATMNLSGNKKIRDAALKVRKALAVAFPGDPDFA